ncbi:hypothetical protein FB45DRAFT_1064125 [Roridomyces roridus]|uniref:Uncharacterized protein n=1 Tax=Roridomyces roridus TaxID=1738132 RepID=A0AAD7BAX0_9AGAR|nr:hypothetical protein FB45DRAFT_1064125 [Roridomyces roridus]
MRLLYLRATPGRLPLAILTTAMALLATAQFAMHIGTTVLGLLMLVGTVEHGTGSMDDSLANPPTYAEKVYWVLKMVQDLMLLINCVMADSLFVYRCYLVWGRPRKSSWYFQCYFSSQRLVSTGCITTYDEDYIDAPPAPFTIDPRIVFVLTLFTNFSLMSLTAGRIWWVTRQQRAVLGPEFMPPYNAAMAIILESGVVYCAGLNLQVVALTIQNSQAIPVYLTQGAATQLVSIAPTLIVVRVGMGHTTPTTRLTCTGNTTGVDVRRPKSIRFARMGQTTTTVDECELAMVPVVDIGAGADRDKDKDKVGCLESRSFSGGV